MKFEYLTIQMGGMPIKQADLNELGNDGWGLVSVGFDTAYFMRESKVNGVESETVTAASGPFVTTPKPVATTSSSGTKHNPKGKK